MSTWTYWIYFCSIPLFIKCCFCVYVWLLVRVSFHRAPTFYTVRLVFLVAFSAFRIVFPWKKNQFYDLETHTPTKRAIPNISLICSKAGVLICMIRKACDIFIQSAYFDVASNELWKPKIVLFFDFTSSIRWFGVKPKNKRIIPVHA